MKREVLFLAAWVASPLAFSQAPASAASEAVMSLAGYEIVKVSVPVAPNNSAIANAVARCPKGKVFVGAGYTVDGTQVQVIDSGITGTNEWTARARNPSTSQYTLSLQLICVKK